MIQVNLPSPPESYVSRVKKPGEAFLRKNLNPSNSDWKRNSYWRSVHSHLYNQLKGVCMYCASWTPRTKNSEHFDHTSIDHYIPKSLQASGAYEWSNFRLCRARLNNKKSNFTDVVDPFVISNDWFFLEFTTFLIKPAPELPDNIKEKVKKTIDRLELNIDNDYVHERIAIIKEYCMDSNSRFSPIHLY